MKKRSDKLLILTAILFISIILLSVSFVAAQASAQPAPTNARTFTQGVVDIVTGGIDLANDAGSPLFGALLGEASTGADLFVKVLIFLLVVLVTIAVLQLVPFFAGRAWLQFAVGAIISILGTRFIPNDMIQALAFPSSVFVASIAIGIPFIIYGLVLYKSGIGPAVRKLGWIIFAVVLVVLWFYNAEASRDRGFMWIYPSIVALSAVVFWFDGTLSKYLGRANSQRAQENLNNQTRYRTISDIEKLENSLASGSLSPSDATKARRDLTNKRKFLNSL